MVPVALAEAVDELPVLPALVVEAVEAVVGVEVEPATVPVGSSAGILTPSNVPDLQ